MLVLGGVGKAERVAVGEWIDDAKGDVLPCARFGTQGDLCQPFAWCIAGKQTGELPFDAPAFDDLTVSHHSRKFETPVLIEGRDSLIDECQFHAKFVSVANDVCVANVKIAARLADLLNGPP